MPTGQPPVFTAGFELICQAPRSSLNLTGDFGRDSRKSLAEVFSDNSVRCLAKFKPPFTHRGNLISFPQSRV